MTPTQARREAIRVMYERGDLVPEIAQTFGIEVVTLRTLASRWSWKRPNYKPRRVPCQVDHFVLREDQAECRALRAEGKSYGWLADWFGWTEAKVGRALRKSPPGSRLSKGSNSVRHGPEIGANHWESQTQ